MSNAQFTAETEGERVDAFLARVADERSRSFWQKRCEQDDVLVNDKPVKASHKLQVGDTVKVETPDPVDFSGESIPILYEDDDIIVLNKPAGILTHAKGGELPEFTVAEFMRTRTTDGIDTNRPGIVHRLDRGTSGVMVAAKNSAAKRWLQKQFSERNVKKTYIALVEGHLRQGEAILRLPIERNPKKPQTFRVGANGLSAETAYNVTQSYSKYDLVELKPHTGRTHQLRVHMSYLGNPIVGDSIYGHPDKALGRMFLHAYQLELTLPSKLRTTFTAPMPDDLEAYLATLQ